MDADTRDATETATDRPLKARVALVTGASAGIGLAIATRLATRGATVVGVARGASALYAAASAAGFEGIAADATDDVARARLVSIVLDRHGGIDILVHCAGSHALGRLDTAPIADLDRQFAANVRSPAALTQLALPSLRDRSGQVVFVNSSVGLRARAEAGHFAATQHALKALADALREEVNADGVRVLTVHPGRTATPRQKRIHEIEGRAYRPERLLQPEDIAGIVVASLELPSTAEVTDINIRSMRKP